MVIQSSNNTKHVSCASLLHKTGGVGGVVIAVKKKELPLKLGIFRQVNDVFLFLKTAYAAWRNVYVNVNSGYLLGEVFTYVSFKLRGIFAYFFLFLQ